MNKNSSPALTACVLETTISTGVDAGIMGSIVAKLCRQISRVAVSLAAFVDF
jgi:hypothetical protein